MKKELWRKRCLRLLKTIEVIEYLSSMTLSLEYNQKISEAAFHFETVIPAIQLLPPLPSALTCRKHLVLRHCRLVRSSIHLHAAIPCVFCWSSHVSAATRYDYGYPLWDYGTYNPTCSRSNVRDGCWVWSDHVRVMDSYNGRHKIWWTSCQAPRLPHWSSDMPYHAKPATSSRSEL
ncbi:Uncharacterized protein HZ326_27965 [Fusarium oxysporum f. sp. albedinis]|nr:Uncharacterized protein HZ326_27965 [Fusarium oxysporum f. sp. albedinis]